MKITPGHIVLFFLLIVALVVGRQKGGFAVWLRSKSMNKANLSGSPQSVLSGTVLPSIPIQRSDLPANWPSDIGSLSTAPLNVVGAPNRPKP